MLPPKEATFSTTPAIPTAIPIPYRSLVFPDFQNLRFDIYQTAKFYLAYHQTSNLADQSKQWPECCLQIGWEKYYSEAYEETGWQKISGGPIKKITNLALHPATCALHYGPAAFEGAKAMVSAKGRIVLFRPEMNAKRLQRSASRLLMPKVPIDMFMDAVTQTVLANREFVPPFRREDWVWETRSPKCAYIRPLLFGHGPELGVKTAKDHVFLVFISPVSVYWPTTGLHVLVTTHFHRAAPGGIGNVKASGNYASGLLPTALAKKGYDWIEGKPVKVSEQPFHDVLYLDAVHNQFIEEFSAANFLVVTTEGTVVAPESDSILPGNTCDSVLALARSEGWRVEVRPLPIDEVMDESRVAEAFCTGNAAIITPVADIHYKGKTRRFKSTQKTKRLWDLLVGVQLQMIEDKFGWVQEIG